MLSFANVVSLSEAFQPIHSYWNRGGWWGFWWIWIVVVFFILAIGWGSGSYYRGNRPYGRRRSDRRPPTTPA
jgi:hypothetical protein